jgi:hypothetical protein
MPKNQNQEIDYPPPSKAPVYLMIGLTIIFLIVAVAVFPLGSLNIVFWLLHKAIWLLLIGVVLPSIGAWIWKTK